MTYCISAHLHLQSRKLIPVMPIDSPIELWTSAVTSPELPDDPPLINAHLIQPQFRWTTMYWQVAQHFIYG